MFDVLKLKITRIAAAATAALMLAACSAGEWIAGGDSNGVILRRSTVTTIPGGEGAAALQREIIFAVDISGGDVFITAAENFCKTANSLARNGIVFKVEKSSNPVSDINSGRAGLALVGGNKADETHSFFNIAAERFRYSGYEDFSMICNSDDVLYALSDACGMNVFASYYTGSNVLASYTPPDKLISGSRASNQEGDAQTASVYGIPGSGMAGMLSPLCQSTTETASLSERIIALSVRDAIVEFTPDELTRAGFTYASAHEVVAEAAGNMDDETLQDDDYPDSVVFTRTFHGITPAWLMLAPQLYESLTPQARTAVDEAAAGMFGDIDKYYLDREQAIFDMLLYENMGTLQESFALTRMRILRLADEKRGEVTVEEQRLLDSLNKLR